MVFLTRRQLVLALAAGLVASVLGGVAQAGIILSIYCDDPLQSLTHDALGFNTGSMDASHHESQDATDGDQSRTRELELLILLDSLKVAGPQAGQSPGMSSGGPSVGGSSSQSAPVACLVETLNLGDPPLLDRIFDNSSLILPTGPIFELLRPA